MCPSPSLAQGPRPGWKKPRLMLGHSGEPPPRAGLPWEWVQAGRHCPGQSPRKVHAGAPDSKKTGCGVGMLLTSPSPTYTCSWQTCSLTLTSSPSHGGPGTHLISPGCPGTVPALSPWPMLGQDASPAWKNPVRPICLWGVENGRGGGLGGREVESPWLPHTIPSP